METGASPQHRIEDRSTTRQQIARAVYRLELDKARLRAIAARQRRDTSDALANTEAELASVCALLGAMRAEAGDALPDSRLSSILHLSVEELDLLWCAVAATMDPALSPHIRDLAGGEGRHGMSIALHAVLARLDHDVARTLTLVLTPSHPLLRYGLLEPSNDAVPAARTLTVPDRLAQYLAGENTIDPVVLRFGAPIDVDLDPHYDRQQVESLKRVVRGLSTDDPVVVLIEGPIDVGKRTAAAFAAMATEQRLVHVDALRLPSSIGELEQALRALRRECLLGNALPLISHVDELNAGDDRSRIRTLARMLDETPVAVIATSTISGLDLGTQRRVLRIPMPTPDHETRAVLWRRAVGERSDIDIETLSHRYQLGAGGIRRAVAAANLLAHDPKPTMPEIVQGIRNGIAERLGELAQRIEVNQSWSDLVLGVDTYDQIVALVSRVRHAHQVLGEWGFNAKLPRGTGTAALFSGPPGTGKTMVAGLIARELELELYQIDLSKVVSKWVGETEKQLAKIFDAAEAGHALLLFDEADSLFAKRTEVKSANDRYANLEVNYLLQRIESFGGISILTTNLDTSIDPALRRRLAAHIVFYPPDVEERTFLWESMLPASAPRGQLDFASLADRFPDMTGANIRNAVIAAAFLAASEQSVITQQHLERAGRGEYSAMGRVTR